MDFINNSPNYPQDEGSAMLSLSPQALNFIQLRESTRQSYKRLRQSSMAASLYDPLSARDVMRKSFSSLAALGNLEILFYYSFYL